MGQIFSDEWKIWIWTSVANGIDKAILFKKMLDAGWRYSDIVGELGFDPKTLENEHAALPPEQSIIGPFYQDPQQCDADCLGLVGSTCRVVNRDGVTGYICLAPK